MVGKAHSAQSLTVQLLKLLDPWDRAALNRRLSEKLAGSETANQLQLCIMMAGQPETTVNKYHRDLESLATTILLRQTNKKAREITLTDVGQAMGFQRVSAAKLTARIQSMERELQFHEIENLCAGFQRESDRRFWRNQIYLLFPELAVPDVTEGPELHCLQKVWDCLQEETRETAQLIFISQKEWFDQLEHRPRQTPSHCEGLYDLIAKVRKRAKKSQEDILSVLDMDRDTYGSYKKLWTNYEASGCKGPYPRNRLSRERLLFLVIYLDLDFYTAVAMLAMGGYAFQTGEPDRTVAEYLLNRKHPKQAVLNKLHPTVK